MNNKKTSNKNGNTKKPVKALQVTDSIDFKHLNPMHIAVIDEYFANGFNQVKAVLSANSGLAYGSAQALTSTILKADVNQAYIRSRQDELKASTNIQTNQVVRELISLSYSDITDYIDLTVKELKSLPPEVRRCINSYDIKTKKYKDRDGQMIEDVTVKIKLNDKLKSLDMLSKYIGLYDEDNKQKAPKLDIRTLNVNQLQVLLSITNNEVKE